MIEYLKSVIGKQLEEQEAEAMKQSEVDDSTILEYASLFQELDDLTLHGDGTAPTAVEVIETVERDPINIPLDSYDPDIEIQTIEMDVTDGRVINIPSDATVTESAEVLTEEEQNQKDIEEIEEQYTGMKTYMDFFNEAAAEICRLPRESDARYAARIDEYIAESWKEYNEQLYQESLFGHGKIAVTDMSVPDKIHINFGKETDDSSKDYSVTLPIKWQVDKKGNVTKKQIDSVQVWSKFGDKALSKMTDTVFNIICDKYKEDTKKKKWDILTPVVVCVPIEPSDEYTIVIGFETDFSKETEYFEFSVPVKSFDVSKKNQSLPENVSTDVKKYSVGDAEKNMVRKRDYKLEMMENKVDEEEEVVSEQKYNIPTRRSRFYQEAIDFGGGATADAGTAPAADAGTTPPPADPNAAAPDPNAGGTTIDANAGNVDPNANTTDPNAAAAAPEQPAPDAEPANVNDVSDQIADKVSQTTEDQNAETPEAPADDTADVDAAAGDLGDAAPEAPMDETPDTETPDADNIGDVDSEIDSLGSESSDESADDATADSGETPEDLDDLTIDQLIAQGSEKLKSMSIGQLKDFINAPDGTTPEEIKEENPVDDETTTESANIELLDEKVMMENFFTDASNIRERINAAIEDVVPGLKKIQENCSDGNWDRYKLREFWRDVPDKSGTELESGRTGSQFCSQISDLRHFLNVTKKKRAKDVFTTEQLSKLNDFNVKLDQFSHLCDKACNTLKIKYDISMKDIADDAEKTLEMCNDVKDMITSEEFSECYYQEALFITRRNVSNYVLDHVASSLGILNNTEMPFQQLVVAFKKEAKKMNKVLNKASKMKCYSDAEKTEIKKLNVKLAELASYIRMNNLNDSYTNRVKRAIKEYVAQCKIVSNIMEQHADKKKLKKKKNKQNSVVQEMGSGCSASKVDNKIQECGDSTSGTIPPIPTEVSETDAPELNDNSTSVTADTTTGTDVASGTAASDALTSADNVGMSGTSNATASESSEPVGSTSADTNTSAPVNEEAELQRQFEEFMSSY